MRTRSVDRAPPKRPRRHPAAWAAAFVVACGSDGAGRAQVEEGEWLPGGETTNTLFLGVNAFTRHAENITDEHESDFFSGNSFFNQAWVQAPSSTQSRDGLGPLFNARSCAACHFKDGRGRPPLEPDEPFLGLLLRIGPPGTGERGAPLTDPVYGGQLQPFAIADVPPEGRPTVTYREVSGSYADGVPYTLLEPTYTIQDFGYGDPVDGLAISPRVAPAVAGLGLLEAIEVSRLEALADPDDANGDGISGRINQVWDATLQQTVVGRFGWKAEQPTVRQQSAGAFLGDIGITTSVFPDQGCSPSQTECAGAIHGGEPEFPADLLDKLTIYTQLLAVPFRERWDDREVLRGKALFQEAGCGSCHVARHVTGTVPGLPEVSGQTIWPYTDLLLHDMGEELSDGRPSFDASGAEWRTPPLWGLRLYETVNKHDRLLHDGRARGVAEAILWHGGEGAGSRDAFRNLERSDRDALVQFVESL